MRSGSSTNNWIFGGLIMKFKTTQLEKFTNHIFLYGLLFTWFAILVSFWLVWQSVSHSPQTNVYLTHQHDFNSHSYLSYLEMHQRFAPKHKAVIKTIHVCNQSQSMQQPSSSIGALGCNKQLKSRFI